MNSQAEDEATWAADREFRAVQRAERTRIAALPIGEQQAVFIRLLGELGSIQEVCEFMGVSRYVVAKWRRANPEVSQAVKESNEAAYDMLESWLHDYGRGHLKSGPGQVETQWRLFYHRNKYIRQDNQALVDNRRYIVNLITGNPDARAALSVISRIVAGDAGGPCVEVQPGAVETSSAPGLSE